jgi:hypothetical protein
MQSSSIIIYVCSTYFLLFTLHFPNRLQYGFPHVTFNKVAYSLDLLNPRRSQEMNAFCFHKIWFDRLGIMVISKKTNTFLLIMH